MEKRTVRLTSNGHMAKEKNYNQTKSNENEGFAEHTPKKICKCPPTCILCCATADLNDKYSKITQKTICCSMCLVALCIKKKGKRKSSCFEIFHQIRDLSSLKGKKASSTSTQLHWDVLLQEHFLYAQCCKITLKFGAMVRRTKAMTSSVSIVMAF